MAAVENDTQFTRSADLMGRYRCHLTSNASQECRSSSLASKCDLEKIVILLIEVNVADVKI